MENKDFIQECINAHERSFEKAREDAIKTKTFLIYERNGKIVRIDPQTMKTINELN